MITYKPLGRFGNNLFQYLACKLLEQIWKTHTYVDYFSSLSYSSNVIVTFTDDDFTQLTDGTLNHERFERSTLIICHGYFQKSKLYVQYRDVLLKNIINSNDKFIHRLSDFAEISTNNSGIFPIKELFEIKPVDFEPTDIVIALRLDDFMHYHLETSDIVSPLFYVEILDSLTFSKLYIVSDKLRHNWEKRYIDVFQRYNFVHIQGSVLDDFAALRAAPRLIHSNSTLCWIASFFGKATKRWIPRTYFYAGQQCLQINAASDSIFDVKPLTRHEAMNIDTLFADKTRLHCLSYAIPDELIVNDVPSKTELWASVIPGREANYQFGPGQEKEYHEMYQRARFAITMKKGGWDCLRHYEILANGCIPIFQDLRLCPAKTLNSFPKDLLLECEKVLYPWRDTPEHIELYNSYVRRLLQYTRENLSCSALASRFLKTMNLTPAAKILFIRCHPGVNYSREFLFIGLHRMVASCVMYPQLPYLYTDFSLEEAGKLYGNGFGYTRRLVKKPGHDDNNFTESSIENHEWDLIVYAKMGIDEQHDGTVPRSPLWDLVSKNYKKHEIAFLYGGDACHNLQQTASRYITHLESHLKLGHCFVRELSDG